MFPAGRPRRNALAARAERRVLGSTTAYVEEGFGFVALKLVPGIGVDAIRPVRVTTPGGEGQSAGRVGASGLR
jgi:hypothetical protein